VQELAKGLQAGVFAMVGVRRSYFYERTGTY
jgi:hypothetical protein